MMSVSVCRLVFVCLSASISPELHVQSLPKFLCMLRRQCCVRGSVLFLVGCRAIVAARHVWPSRWLSTNISC